jgi:hypothetical protein
MLSCPSSAARQQLLFPLPLGLQGVRQCSPMLGRASSLPSLKIHCIITEARRETPDALQVDHRDPRTCWWRPSLLFLRQNGQWMQSERRIGVNSWALREEGIYQYVRHVCCVCVCFGVWAALSGLPPYSSIQSHSYSVQATPSLQTAHISGDSHHVLVLM